jgi:cbb3-type cytochrome oxidase maturation protein
MMIGVSLLLGGLALVGVIWAIKTGQFDDKDKMMNTVLDDGEDALNEAAEKERRKKEYRKLD